MKLQHQIILSLGSNQGNRLDTINRCIELIHQEIGSVIKISRLFETPSWGFEGESFYNCALLVKTIHNPHEVLKIALLLEKKLGRIRSLDGGYQSRIIDIDIIIFDNMIVDTDALKIPHPLMHKRNFVLLPVLDLQIDWEHPILKKTIPLLIEECEDISSCVVLQNIELPKH